MVTIGVDAHKQVHVAEAVDEVGRSQDTWRGDNSAEAWEELRAWGQRWEHRQWGIEGTGSYGKGLAQYLAAAGETVFEVNPRLTAEARSRARRRDKSDRLDALAVARTVLRDDIELPVVVSEEEDGPAVLDELCRQRGKVLSQIARVRNQLHGQLFKLDPGYKKTFPSLRKLATVQELERHEPPSLTPLQQVQAAEVRHLAHLLHVEMARCRELTTQIETISQERYPELMTLEGAGALTAGRLAGVLGTRQFRTEAQFSTYGAASPLDTSSAGVRRHRLNPGDNRQLNNVFYLMALNQWKRPGRGHEYIERRMREGKSWREAVPPLKRFIAREIWAVWDRHYANPLPAVPLAARS